MPNEAIFMPMLALVVLTFLVWVRMYRLRIAYIITEKIDPRKYKSRSAYSDVPDKIMYPSENLMNLFEVPVLFYAAVLSIYVTSHVDVYFVVLAWAYVGLRYAHSFIHITYNNAMHRFSVYFVSTLILWVLWARFVYVLSSEGG